MTKFHPKGFFLKGFFSDCDQVHNFVDLLVGRYIVSKTPPQQTVCNCIVIVLRSLLFLFYLLGKRTSLTGSGYVLKPNKPFLFV